MLIASGILIGIGLIILLVDRGETGFFSIGVIIAFIGILIILPTIFIGNDQPSLQPDREFQATVVPISQPTVFVTSGPTVVSVPTYLSTAAPAAVPTTTLPPPTAVPIQVESEPNAEVLSKKNCNCCIPLKRPLTQSKSCPKGQYVVMFTVDCSQMEPCAPTCPEHCKK